MVRHPHHRSSTATAAIAYSPGNSEPCRKMLRLAFVCGGGQLKHIPTYTSGVRSTRQFRGKNRWTTHIAISFNIFIYNHIPNMPIIAEWSTNNISLGQFLCRIRFFWLGKSHNSLDQRSCGFFTNGFYNCSEMDLNVSKCHLHKDRWIRWIIKTCFALYTLMFIDL